MFFSWICENAPANQQFTEFFSCIWTLRSAFSERWYHWKAVVLPDAAYYVHLDLPASWTCSEAPWEADDITVAY